ncbi:hypothetical protein G6F68_010560 [Rhizopus microsporus]|nr:hypothetical protein G6F68_010560 [Rhizopus microsporus]
MAKGRPAAQPRQPAARHRDQWRLRGQEPGRVRTGPAGRAPRRRGAASEEGRASGGDAAYAARFRAAVDAVRARESAMPEGQRYEVTRAVARNLAKLMTYKDEYEVARLYTDPAFKAKLQAQFEGEPGRDYRVRYYLAPPAFARRDTQGRLEKRAFGAWMGVAFRMLAPMKRVRGTWLDLFGKTAEAVLSGIEGVQIIACGTSYYAGLTARYWIEAIAGLPCSVEIASEYRYRAAYANPKHLIVTISQSGETLDTMEALKYAKSLGHKHTLSICNVPESAIPRASELVCYTRAGAEIGVASTKAFTTQLAALFQLTVVLGKLRGRIDAAQEADYLEQLRFLPGSVQHALNMEPQIAAWAERFARKSSALKSPTSTPKPIRRAS